MKKLILIICTLAIVVSCKKDEKFTLSTNSIRLTHGETVQLTSSVPAEYTSLDTNVAKVNSSGVITGVRLGATQIYATAGDITLACGVTVDPRSNLYREPLFKVTQTRNQIKNYETRELDYDGTDALIYRGENSDISAVIYLIDITFNGAAVLLNGTSTVIDRAYEFLEERYPELGKIGYQTYAFDVDDERAVVLGYDSDLGYHVMYLLLSDKSMVKQAHRSRVDAIITAR